MPRHHRLRSPAAELAEVDKRFGRTVALDGASFAVGEGEVVAVLGPNGAGKSTALSILLGLRRPDAGRARALRPRSARSLGAGARGRDAAGDRFPVDAARARARRARPLPLPASACRRETLSTGSGSAASAAGRSADCRWGSAGGSAWRSRSPGARGSSCSTSPPRASTARRASRCGRPRERTRARAARSCSRRTSSRRRTRSRNASSSSTTARVVADGPVADLKAAAGLTVVALPRATRRRRRRRARRRVRPHPHADGGAEVERLVRAGVPLAELEVRPVTLEEALAAREAAE